MRDRAANHRVSPAKVGKRAPLPVPQPRTIARDAQHARRLVIARQILQIGGPLDGKLQQPRLRADPTRFALEHAGDEIRQIDMTQHRVAAPTRGIHRFHLPRVGIQSLIPEPAVANRRTLIALEGTIDLAQQVAVGFRVRFLAHLIQRTDQRRLILEQRRLPLGEARDKSHARRLLFRRDAKRVGHECEMFARLFVFRDQAQQQPLLERAGKIEIADLRIRRCP